MNQSAPAASAAPDPSHIMQIGMSFFPCKILLTAVKLDLFTELAARKGASAAELKSHFGFHCTDRHFFDFLDTLVALGFLTREGLLTTAKYNNAPDSDLFLDKAKPAYIGGMLTMANNRLYAFWGDLEDGLRTGQAQNEIKHGGDNLFEAIYHSPQHLREFIHAMSGVQMGNFMAFAKKVDFSGRKTLADLGGSGAMLSIMVAKHNPHMHCVSFDLPPVAPVADENITKFGIGAQVKTVAGDFFTDTLPAVDVLVMGNILHDWDEEKKLELMKRVYDALPAGGAFAAIENVIDDDRRQNVFGMMMSLNMLIETAHGFDYSYADFRRWAMACGFSRTELVPLTGPSSAAIAYK
jgi:hypothetical protein